MLTIEHVIQEINKELVPQFEQKLRSYLQGQSPEWLVEQIIRLTLDKHSLQSKDRSVDRKAKAQRVARRAKRLREMGLDEDKLTVFINRYTDYSRERLINEKFLLPTAPVKGAELITESHRTTIGSELLQQAKDILFGLLFGREHTNTHFDRVEQELLALTVPRHKAHALDFMQATTEMTVLGTWQDPESVSDDDRAENLILEMEYGEVKSERIGDGIIATLSLINNLEINEQILYARMMNVEQSSLIS